MRFIGIQETKKTSFTLPWLENIGGSSSFSWCFIPAVGQPGGLLCGINTDFYDIVDSEKGSHHIRFLVRDKGNGEHLNIVNVYGAPHNKDKEYFLVELVHIFDVNSFPIIIGGDFNIIRKRGESNRNKPLNKWSHLFTAIIENWEMKEVELNGRIFTWSNNQENPVFEKLDRILMSLSFESLFPLMFLRALPRVLSDHAPLLLDFGLNLPKITRPFKFELCWFLRKDLDAVVIGVLCDSYYGKSLQDQWQNRARALRKKLKGWNLNSVWFYKKQKVFLARAIDDIDRESELIGLTRDKYILRKNLEEELSNIHKEEEIKWL